MSLHSNQIYLLIRVYPLSLRAPACLSTCSVVVYQAMTIKMSRVSSLCKCTKGNGCGLEQCSIGGNCGSVLLNVCDILVIAVASLYS